MIVPGFSGIESIKPSSSIASIKSFSVSKFRSTSTQPSTYTLLPYFSLMGPMMPRSISRCSFLSLTKFPLSVRAWMCTHVAPASMQSRADCLTSSGVYGWFGFFALLIGCPVTWQVMPTTSGIFHLG